MTEKLLEAWNLIGVGEGQKIWDAGFDSGFKTSDPNPYERTSVQWYIWEDGYEHGLDRWNSSATGPWSSEPDEWQK